MVFEENKKNISYYTTPFGTMQMGIAATHVKNLRGGGQY